MIIETGIIQNQWIVLAILVWTTIWKGLALWVAARRRDKWWFIAMLVLSTIGLIEIFYLFVWTKRGKWRKEKRKMKIENVST